MKFSIITVNYNGAGRIGRCMAAVAAQNIGDFEMLIVDNASTDHSGQTPVPDARFRWLYPGKNLGFAAGNNLAAREARGEWLFLLNPDAYMQDECLATLVKAMQRHPDCVLFGCTQLDDAAPDLLDGAGDCYTFIGYPYRGGENWGIEVLPDEGEVWGPCGAAYLIRRDVFEAMGGFDEDFFCYCEDVDLNFRLRLQGYHAIQVSEAFVRHEGSGITGRRSYFSLFHGTRNRLWTFIKNMPPALFWPLLPLHAALLCLLLMNPKYFHPRWDGLKAALKGLPAIWRKRQEVQKTRKIPLWKLMRAFTWSPRKLLWRMADVRVRGQ
ncbi:MAG: glycosyltransferase family 2 protein [Proteobacteria bacterium]|nr:glycosyltransferase family 2 protein [Pseudomonadota bacterium]